VIRATVREQRPCAHCWLTTDRLGLRRFTTTDLDWLASLYADPDVTRFLGGTKAKAQVQAMLTTRILDYYYVHPGLGMWMTIERATGAPVGFHLINHIQGESIIQIGFGLARPAWGRGFATEMASALLRYAFVDLELDYIAGIASLANVASQQVLQKIGLQRHGERTFSHPAYRAQGPLAWFERTAADWKAERADRGRPLTP
jgi:ribosomal-protein-alanine N-acetyltransferase